MSLYQIIGMWNVLVAACMASTHCTLVHIIMCAVLRPQIIQWQQSLITTGGPSVQRTPWNSLENSFRVTLSVTHVQSNPRLQLASPHPSCVSTHRGVSQWVLTHFAHTLECYAPVPNLSLWRLFPKALCAGVSLMPGPGSTHSMCVICTNTRSCYIVKHSDSVCTLHCSTSCSLCIFLYYS